MGKKYMDTKSGSLEDSILGVWEDAVSSGTSQPTDRIDGRTSNYRSHRAKLEAARVKREQRKLAQETNKNDKSDDGEGLDAVQPKAVKKKFDDRTDKDIDNDGDVDSSDKYLHKRRKAVSKAIKNEEVELNAGKMSEIDQMKKDGKSAEDIAKALKMDVKSVKKVMGEAYELGTNEYRDYTLKVTPGETDPEWVKARDFKVASMKEALAKVWGLDEKHVPGHNGNGEEPKKKNGQTDTGKKAAAVEIDPDLKNKMGKE